MMHQFRWSILVDTGRKTVWLLDCCEFGGLWAIAPKGFIIFSCVCSGCVVQCVCTKNMMMTNRVHSTAKFLLNALIPAALHMVIVNIMKLKSCPWALRVPAVAAVELASRVAEIQMSHWMQVCNLIHRLTGISSWTGSWERMRVYPPLLCWKEQPSFQHSQG